MKTLGLCVILAGCLILVKGHSYHLGACPVVEPMQGFQMNKFLGVWYVIQKTSTASKCITYNYTRGEEPGEYVITQDSDHPVIGLTPLKHEYHYTGELSVPEPSTPGRMQVRFPLSEYRVQISKITDGRESAAVLNMVSIRNILFEGVAGSASHVVIDTDYTHYAAVFSCQKLAFAHRQSATILSRQRDLDAGTTERLRQRMSNYGIDPYDLSIIPQTGCPVGNNSLDININPGTFTAENFGNVVRKAGEKIGDGVEWVAHTGSKVYHKLAGTEEKPKPEENGRRGEVVRDSGKIETNEVEWIP